MSSALQLTVHEYQRMVKLGAFDHLHRKIELIDGEICEMNPAGPVHDDYIAYLTDWSFRTTDRSQIRVTSQTGLDLEPWDSQPEPDIMWVRAARYRERHPTQDDVRLAIEVADSSFEFDSTRKSTLYASAGIFEYWIVDVQGQCGHVFRKPEGGVYGDRRVARTGEQVSPLEACLTPLDLKDLFLGQ